MEGSGSRWRLRGRGKDASAVEALGARSPSKFRRFWSGLLACSCLRRKQTGTEAGIAGGGGGLSSDGAADDQTGAQTPATTDMEGDDARWEGDDDFPPGGKDDTEDGLNSSGLKADVDAGGSRILGRGGEIVSRTRGGSDGGMWGTVEVTPWDQSSARRSGYRDARRYSSRQNLAAGYAVAEVGAPRSGVKIHQRERRGVGWTRFQ